MAGRVSKAQTGRPRARLTTGHAPAILEWLESVGPDDLVSRQPSKSEPDMDERRDVDGFNVPPAPVFAGSPRSNTWDNVSTFSAAGASDASGPSSGVCHPLYRQYNLAFNHIYIRPSAAPLPEVISGHMDAIRAERDSPEPPSDEFGRVLRRLDNLAEGCTENDVAAFLNDTVFPNLMTDHVYGPSTGLISSSSDPILRHLVPNHSVSHLRVTQPKPAGLYGYSRIPNAAFTESQLLAQMLRHPQNPEYAIATSQGLRFPFLVVEFKAAGGTRGDLWVATNQCAGASSACLNAIDQLNTMLREIQSVEASDKQVEVDKLAYCIAVDNNIAQLYVSWKEDGSHYYLQQVDVFLLWNEEHFNSLRRQVRNIFDWGKGTRLKQIQSALDIVVEDNRKNAAEHAKTRQPPSVSSTTTTSMKAKSSS